VGGYLIEFLDDDESYLRWLASHQDGLVVNTTRSRSPSYMVLHRASCPYITAYMGRASRPGGFTERGYIKVCAVDVPSLRAWARQHGRLDGSFSSECPRCEPD